MSEDRNKHDRAGSANEVKGYRVGRPIAERKTGMGQRIPEKVRDEVEGKGKGAK